MNTAHAVSTTNFVAVILDAFIIYPFKICVMLDRASGLIVTDNSEPTN